jgi:ParB family transcriptional regulator, chromosome partitioning protein
MKRGIGGLGRGLDALIPSAAVNIATEIGVEEIVPNPWQPRQEADATALEELAASIRQFGLLQPLVVTQAEDGRYQLIAGERRWLAAKLAGLEFVPAIVREASPQEALELALVENIQRADLNPLEEATAYRRLIDEFDLTQEQVAARVGKGRVSVANSLRLLGLPEEAKAALAAGKISEGHARAVLRVPDVPGQLLVLNTIMDKDLSVRQAEELARRLVEDLSRHIVSTPRTKPPETAALERNLMSVLGTKVDLYHSRKGGKVVIYFYSDEEFQSLYDRLVT